MEKGVQNHQGNTILVYIKICGVQISGIKRSIYILKLRFLIAIRRILQTSGRKLSQWRRKAISSNGLRVDWTRNLRA